MTTTIEQTRPNPLITASRVQGTGVFNAKGERIGHIEDLSIDKASGQVRYALMSFGGFLGLGDKLHPLPWQVLSYSPAHAGYIVPLEKEALKGAPSYSTRELEAFGGYEPIREDIFLYYEQYGATRFW